jgi:hypothetical protein
MKMTRKDFILIANTIMALLDAPRKTQVAALFADALKDTNENFDVQRFVRASLEGKNG